MKKILLTFALVNLFAFQAFSYTEKEIEKAKKFMNESIAKFEKRPFFTCSSGSKSEKAPLNGMTVYITNTTAFSMYQEFNTYEGKEGIQVINLPASILTEMGTTLSERRSKAIFSDYVLKVTYDTDKMIPFKHLSFELEGESRIVNLTYITISLKSKPFNFSKGPTVNVDFEIKSSVPSSVEGKESEDLGSSQHFTAVCTLDEYFR